MGFNKESCEKRFNRKKNYEYRDKEDSVDKVYRRTKAEYKKRQLDFVDEEELEEYEDLLDPSLINELKK